VPRSFRWVLAPLESALGLHFLQGVVAERRGGKLALLGEFDHELRQHQRDGVCPIGEPQVLQRALESVGNIFQFLGTEDPEIGRPFNLRLHARRMPVWSD
jgi:hypothetical protein